MALPRRPLPRLALVRQHLRTEHIGNPREEACAKLLAAGLGSKIGKGSHVAITAGSRGPGGFVELLNGICDAIGEWAASRSLFRRWEVMEAPQPKDKRKFCAVSALPKKQCLLRFAPRWKLLHLEPRAPEPLRIWTKPPAKQTASSCSGE